MRLQVYSTQLRSLGLFLIALGLVLASLAGCSSHKSKPAPTTTTKRDAGAADSGEPALDGNLPGTARPDVDAAGIIPGSPPPELAGQACAVDTNKLFEVATSMRQPEPTQLAVDLIDSYFGLAYIDKSKDCLDAIFLAELHGASGLGTPDVSTAVDECTTVDHVAVAHNGDAWLLASVDARMDERDLWVQPYKPGSTDTPDANRLTMTLGQKREVALTAIGTSAALAAWVEQDASAGSTALNVRLLSAQGEPTADTLVVDQSDTASFAGLALTPIGTSFVGLGYRRFDSMGSSEIVLQVLDATTGKPDRDAWVLTTQAGAFGSVAITADADGGAVIYSIVQGSSEQLWFQSLDKDGHAAPVISGGKTGGPSDASRIVGPPYNAVDASLTKLPNGFAVAYRALPGGAIQTPRIRVHFLDLFGRVIGDSDVALAAQYGGRTAIAAGYDGRIVFAWSDQDDKTGKTTTTAAKLPCVGGL
jgi:hypothetical protein